MLVFCRHKRLGLWSKEQPAVLTVAYSFGQTLHLEEVLFFDRQSLNTNCKGTSLEMQLWWSMWEVGMWSRGGSLPVLVGGCLGNAHGFLQNLLYKRKQGCRQAFILQNSSGQKGNAAFWFVSPRRLVFSLCKNSHSCLVQSSFNTESLRDRPILKNAVKCWKRMTFICNMEYIRVCLENI